jgi:hypothetical protein
VSRQALTDDAPDSGPTIAVAGDRLRCMSALRAAPEAASFDALSDVRGHHRAAVVGVDATVMHSRTQIREHLRDLAETCEELCRRLPLSEHLLLLVESSGEPPEEDLRREYEIAAQRLHTRLEQVRGRSVVVTVVLTAGCDDYARLAERVLARARQAESLDVGVSLLWRDIAHTPIGMVAANDYL